MLNCGAHDYSRYWLHWYDYGDLMNTSLLFNQAHILNSMNFEDDFCKAKVQKVWIQRKSKIIFYYCAYCPSYQPLVCPTIKSISRGSQGNIFPPPKKKWPTRKKRNKNEYKHIFDAFLKFFFCNTPPFPKKILDTVLLTMVFMNHVKLTSCYPIN